MSESFLGTRVSRRSIVKGMGGVAAASALGAPLALRTRGAAAQDKVELTIWGNNPEW